MDLKHATELPRVQPKTLDADSGGHQGIGPAERGIRTTARGVPVLARTGAGEVDLAPEERWVRLRILQAALVLGFQSGVRELLAKESHRVLLGKGQNTVIEAHELIPQV